LVTGGLINNAHVTKYLKMLKIPFLVFCLHPFTQGHKMVFSILNISLFRNTIGKLADLLNHIFYVIAIIGVVAVAFMMFSGQGQGYQQ
jgi:hypothetical protein